MQHQTKRRRGSKPGTSNNSHGQVPRGRKTNGPNRNRQQNSKKKSSLNPDVLIAAARKRQEDKKVGQTIVTDPVRFDALPLRNELKQTIQHKGFEKTTPIQHLAIPAALEGKNIQGLAQTGTGKTAAFLIPIVQQLLENRNGQALILAPTRELAVQIQQEFKSLTKGMKLFSGCFIGGTNLNKDIDVLRRKQHVIIGTPGRLIDLMKRRVLDIRNIETLVLDEFDRMLDMGFQRDMDYIRNGMHARKQTMLFSATNDKSLEQQVRLYLENPVKVHASTDGDLAAGTIEQHFVEPEGDKGKLMQLRDMLDNEEFERVIIFTETKRQVSALCKKLQQKGIQADDIHGDKTQNARQRSIRDFSSGKVRVLVATDVAARGLDVDNVSHVINYRIPSTVDSYIHRIGRTGRAGKKGVAITMLDPAQ